MLIAPQFKAHPWHGIFIGEKCPDIVTAFIEIVPTDTVKYEIDKLTGYLKIDRPQLYSNTVPALYGFLPQTFCDVQIAELATKITGSKVAKGDGDPLDILVLTEKAIPHGDLILQAIPIGGLCMIDNGEADDKIIAVLKNDAIYGQWKDISDIPDSVLQRLKHYFLTYKTIPGEQRNVVSIDAVYGREHAHEVIKTSMADYRTKFSVGIGH